MNIINEVSESYLCSNCGACYVFYSKNVIK